MNSLKRCWKYLTVIPGIFILLAGYVLDAKELIALHLNPMWWQIIGALMVVASLLFMQIMHERDISSRYRISETPKPKTTGWVGQNRPSENHEWDNELQRYVLKGDREEIQAISDEIRKLQWILIDFTRNDQHPVSSYVPKTADDAIVRAMEGLDEISKKMNRWLKHAGIKHQL